MVFEKFFNSIFGWVLKFDPVYGIAVVAFIITLLSTLAYKYLTDQEALKKLKEDNKKLQEDMKNAKGDVKKMTELQKEAFQKGFIEPMKHQMKPIIVTFIPFVVVFTWLRNTYQNQGEILFSLGWFGTYIIFSILFSILLRKALKVY